MFFSLVALSFVNLICTVPGIKLEIFFIPYNWNSCGKAERRSDVKLEESLKRRCIEDSKNIATETLGRLLRWSVPKATE